jgi:arylsulfatase A-like enzyme
VRRGRARAVLLLLIAACPAAAAARRPNVILISVCSLRADRLSSYGYGRGTTPSIDRLAAEGVLFEQAVSVASWSRPSMMSVMTGLLPRRHEVRDRGWESVLPARHRTLAERLRDLGYRTAAAVTSPDLQRQVGFSRGFEETDWNPAAGVGAPATLKLVLPSDGEGRSARIADHYAGALDWARRNREAPFFLWVADFGQHSVSSRGFVSTRDCQAEAARRWPGRTPLPPPRELPPGEKEPPPWTEDLTDFPWSREEVDVLYDTSLVCTDARVGAFLDALRREGLYDSALVVFLADHGEGLLDRGIFGHQGTPYDELVRVPLIVKRPGGASAGVRVKEPVGTVDVVSTVLREIGAPAPEDLDGRPLQGFWEGRPDRRDVCVQDDRPYSIYRAVRTHDGWKVVLDRATAAVSVFHPAADPGEREDLSAADPARTDALYGALLPCLED